jgi:hypothetical protein
MPTPEEQALQKRNSNAVALVLTLIGVLFLIFSLSLGWEALSYIKKEKNIATITEIKTVNATGKRIYRGQGGEQKTESSPDLPLTQYIATFSFETLLGNKYNKDVELKTIEGQNQPKDLSPLKVGDKAPIHYWAKSPEEFSRVTPQRLVLNFIGAVLFTSLWFMWAYFTKKQNYKGMKIMFVLYAVVLGGSFWNSMPGCEKRYKIISKEDTNKK